MNNLLAGVNTEPQGAISNPVFKGTILETYTWPGNATYFFDFVAQRAVLLVLIIGAVIFFFMFLTGAIAWISSGGDKQSLETAKGKITSALTGLVILLASFAIIRFVEEFFGISILTLDISSLVIQ